MPGFFCFLDAKTAMPTQAALPTANVRSSQDPFPAEQYVTIANVPIFAEHKTKARDGRELKFGYPELQAVAERCNRRIDETGDYAAISVGHTSDPDDPVQKEPEVIGSAGRFRIGLLGEPGQRQRYCILADFHIRKDKVDKYNSHPRRSPELWLEDSYEEMFLDPISLLGAEAPRLDMGLAPLVNAKGSDGAALQHLYSAMKGGMLREKYAAAGPSCTSVFVPAFGDKKKKNYAAPVQVGEIDTPTTYPSVSPPSKLNRPAGGGHHKAKRYEGEAEQYGLGDMLKKGASTVLSRVAKSPGGQQFLDKAANVSTRVGKALGATDKPPPLSNTTPTPVAAPKAEQYAAEVADAPAKSDHYVPQNVPPELMGRKVIADPQEAPARAVRWQRWLRAIREQGKKTAKSPQNVQRRHNLAQQAGNARAGIAMNDPQVKRYAAEQPSDKITPEKAKEILRDGEAHGHKLTPAQKRMFGAAAGKEKSKKYAAEPDGSEPSVQGHELMLSPEDIRQIVDAIEELPWVAAVKDLLRMEEAEHGAGEGEGPGVGEGPEGGEEEGLPGEVPSEEGEGEEGLGEELPPEGEGEEPLEEPEGGGEEPPMGEGGEMAPPPEHEPGEPEATAEPEPGEAPPEIPPVEPEKEKHAAHSHCPHCGHVKYAKKHEGSDVGTSGHTTSKEENAVPGVTLEEMSDEDIEKYLSSRRKKKYAAEPEEGEAEGHEGKPDEGSADQNSTSVPKGEVDKDPGEAPKGTAAPGDHSEKQRYSQMESQLAELQAERVQRIEAYREGVLTRLRYERIFDLDKEVVRTKYGKMSTDQAFKEHVENIIENYRPTMANVPMPVPDEFLDSKMAPPPEGPKKERYSKDQAERAQKIVVEARMKGEELDYGEVLKDVAAGKRK